MVCIGLACTPERVPLKFEVFADNRTVVSVLKEFEEKMEKFLGKTDGIRVMGRNSFASLPGMAGFLRAVLDIRWPLTYQFTLLAGIV